MAAYLLPPSPPLLPPAGVIPLIKDGLVLNVCACVCLTIGPGFAMGESRETRESGGGW